MSFDKSEALGKAEQHALKGEISAAITVYRKIVETDPYDFSSINRLGDLYVGAGQIKDAIEEFSRIADLHLTGGSATRAAYLLKKTVELDPSNAPARMKLGEVYSRENMVESAHEAFVQAGSAFMRSGDIGRAIEANQRALAIKPDSQQAKAAIAKLENEAALNESKNPPGGSKSGGPGSESGPQGAKRKQATGSLDHLLPGFDEDYVVHKISKAEALVGFGQVPQAVSMLKEVLHSAPDNIAIHIKLKDIYLRAEMMSEACFEYQELARICSARNETARAKDYEVRAQRLGQMIAAPAPQSEAQASAGAKKAEPQPIVSNGGGSNNGKSSGAVKAYDGVSTPPDEIARTSDKLAAAAVLQTSATRQGVELKPSDDFFDDSGKLSLQVKETALAHVSESGHALTQVSAPASLSSFPDASVLGLTLIEAHNQPSVGSKRRRWPYAAAVIIICLTAIAISAIKGLSIYDARLNKQYEELVKVGDPNPSPEPALTPTSEGAENEDGDVVKLDPQPTQVVKSSESGRDQQELRDAEPRLDAAPKAAPPVTAESPKATRPQTSSPPLVAPAFDNRAGVDGNSPGGISPGVPEHSSGAAPVPAAPAPPRKASVTVPGEALKRVQPSYPLSARSARQGGTVSVEIVISEDGNVVSARAISGPDLLRNAAVSAAKGWKFKPSTRDGKPVKSTSTITFNFKL
ncbi:MAG TPA: TonB family protein [Blastocatellia bacterium]|jgi:TonB family protein|nr:TonB family protein [Blastocatellia bacterium]